MSEANKLYEGGQADGRAPGNGSTGGGEAAPYNTLFRKRYRQLSDDELQLHDAIKNKADELAKLIGCLNPGVYQRLVGSLPLATPPGLHECDAAGVTLALRHLEDAVYRAVKALTA